MSITRFASEYYFLSNFYPIEITFNGKKYKTAEHAFQAAKCVHENDAERVRNASTPAIAKSIGRRILLKPNWESIKFSIMLEILHIKFQNATMMAKPQETSGQQLEEQNTWHDTYYGMCTCARHKDKGMNILGQLLMLIRDSKSP